MDNKLVLAKELKTGTTSKGKEYLQFFDQDGQQWNFFQGEKFEQNKAYLFGYELENGFNNVKQISPVVNLFKQKALKEIANRNDIIRNYSVCLSYAKDLVVGGKIELGEIFAKADELYKAFQDKADKDMPKEENC